MPTVETEILGIGSGPSGPSAALALSTYGVPTTVITKSRGNARDALPTVLGRA